MPTVPRDDAPGDVVLPTWAWAKAVVSTIAEKKRSVRRRVFMTGVLARFLLSSSPANSHKAIVFHGAGKPAADFMNYNGN